MSHSVVPGKHGVARMDGKLPPIFPFEPIQLVISAFVVSGLGGLAFVTKTPVRLTCRNVFAAVLNSSVIGGGTTMLMMSQGVDNPWLLLAISTFIGLSGTALLGTLLNHYAKGLVSDEVIKRISDELSQSGIMRLEQDKTDSSSGLSETPTDDEEDEDHDSSIHTPLPKNDPPPTNKRKGKSK